jgi:hypothetical protein
MVRLGGTRLPHDGGASHPHQSAPHYARRASAGDPGSRGLASPSLGPAGSRAPVTVAILSPDLKLKGNTC